jgi:hypothetical protein
VESLLKTSRMMLEETQSLVASRLAQS